MKILKQEANLINNVEGNMYMGDNIVNNLNSIKENLSKELLLFLENNDSCSDEFKGKTDNLIEEIGTVDINGNTNKLIDAFKLYIKTGKTMLKGIDDGTNGIEKLFNIGKSFGHLLANLI